MAEYVVRSRPGESTVRVSRPGGVSRVRTRLSTDITLTGVTAHNDLVSRDAADAHPISSITGLQTALDNSGLTAEQIMDLIAGFITAGTGVTVTHDDFGDTLTISADGVAALADLTDVDTATDPPAQNDVLAWDDTAGKWSPATLTVPDAGDQSSFIYHPSGVAEDITYTSWSALMTDLALSHEPRKHIYFAESVTLPTGAHNLNGATLHGNGVFGGTTNGGITVTFPTGCTITNPATVLAEGGIVLYSSSTAAVMTIASPESIYLENDAIVCAKTAAFFDVTAIDGDQVLFAFVRGSGFAPPSEMLIAGGDYEALDHSSGLATVIVAMPTGNQVFYDDTIRGSVIIVVQSAASGTSGYPETASGLSHVNGSVFVIRHAQAFNIGYQAGDATDWTVEPSIVSDALDELAARVIPSTAADVGAVASSLVDGKGELLVGSADNTVDNLAVGTDGHVLTLDSAQALGVKWAAGGGGGTVDVVSNVAQNRILGRTSSGSGDSEELTPAQASILLGVPHFQILLNSTAIGGVPNFSPVVQQNVQIPLNRMHGSLFYVSESITITNVNVIVNNTASAPGGSLARLGLFSVADIAAATLDTTLVSDFGTVGIDTTGTKTITLGSPLTVSPGLYTSMLVGNPGVNVTYAGMGGVSRHIDTTRMANVTNTARTFGVVWGSTADNAAYVAGGLPATFNGIFSDGNVGGSSTTTTNAQFIFYTWAFA